MDQKEKDCAYWMVVLSAGLVLGVIAGLAIAGIAYPIYQSEKWAAWVQAFGSIGAIVSAIYLLHKQFLIQDEQRKKLERDEEIRLLLALRVELKGRLLFYLDEIEEFVNADWHQAVKNSSALPLMPFVAFSALAPKLGIVKNSELLEDVFIAYYDVESCYADFAKWGRVLEGATKNEDIAKRLDCYSISPQEMDARIRTRHLSAKISCEKAVSRLKSYLNEIDYPS